MEFARYIADLSLTIKAVHPLFICEEVLEKHHQVFWRRLQSIEMGFLTNLLLIDNWALGQNRQGQF